MPSDICHQMTFMTFDDKCHMTYALVKNWTLQEALPATKKAGFALFELMGT